MGSKYMLLNMAMALISLQQLGLLWFCDGCWDQERIALLKLKASFSFPPLSWVEGSDCCGWELVECNNITGRVISLNLTHRRDDWNLGKWYLNAADFLVFEDLKILNLSSNSIHCCGQNQVQGFKKLSRRLMNLEVLELSFNYFNDTIVSSLTGFSSLKYLNLQYNLLTERSRFETISSNWSNLEILDLGGNNFTNNILSSLTGFSSLKVLLLNNNGLEGTINVRDINNLFGLKELNLNENKIERLQVFEGTNETQPWWPSTLEVLELSYNTLNNDVLSSMILSKFPSLKSLDLKGNLLQGSVDIISGGLSALNNLEILDLSNNYNISTYVVPKGIIPSLSKLQVLYLDEVGGLDGRTLRQLFEVFSSVTELYLRRNKFLGTISSEDFQDLHNLKNLSLDASSVGNNFIQGIRIFKYLKVLSLNNCDINGTLPHIGWSNLKYLEELHLRHNNFSGTIPQSFGNMTSLRVLDISRNKFIGNIGTALASLTSLEYLCFSYNQFEVPISFASFANHSNLQFIYGVENKVIPDPNPTLFHPKFQLQVFSLSSTIKTNTTLSFPNFFHYQYNLTRVHFTNCKFQAEIPTWLFENNTNLMYFKLKSCSFSGQIQLPLHPKPNLLQFDVSFNTIRGRIPSNISLIFPNLQQVVMSSNELVGSIPGSFGQMNSLTRLELAYNYLSGEIPENISASSSPLGLLKLSHNNLKGKLFPTVSTLTSLAYLSLDGNGFEGSIPISLSNSSLLDLDISQNQLVGRLPLWIGNLSNLQVVSMSENHIEGLIPTEFCKLENLVYLDMSVNNLSGFFPPCSNMISLKYLHLNENKLSGVLSRDGRVFSSNSSLVSLDLGDNDMHGRIPDWIGNLAALNILVLRGNHFMGRIPNQLCLMTGLTIIDLSYNSLSGPIPSCLSNITFKTIEQQVGGMDNFTRGLRIRGHDSRGLNSLIYVQEQVDFTTKMLEHRFYGNVLALLIGIDLSHNELQGDIPPELGNLTEVHSLNLSHNYLTGQIPVSFSNLRQIESLDLSFNKLNGRIPAQLSQLYYLAAFSVAHNNLSGPALDSKGQFSTFEESSYEGNPFLCGPSLHKSCITINDVKDVDDGDGDGDGDFIDMSVFYITFAVSYISILLGITAVLYINPHWRRAWFYFIEFVINSCYYFFVDNFSQISFQLCSIL